MERPLEGKVAVVAGGTRGAGRGISVELGAAGATVYVTGRSSRSGLSPIGRPETIEETAEMVEEQGGRGIAVRVDHSRPGALRVGEDQARVLPAGGLHALLALAGAVALEDLDHAGPDPNTPLLNGRDRVRSYYMHS